MGQVVGPFEVKGSVVGKVKGTKGLSWTTVFVTVVLLNWRAGDGSD